MFSERGHRVPAEVEPLQRRRRRRDLSDHTPMLRAKPPPRSSPRADERRQAGERAEEHRTVLVVLGADERADRRRADRAVARARAPRSPSRRRRTRRRPAPASTRRRARPARRSRCACASTHSWSTRSSRISTCIIASISAMSVPGSGWTNSSADSAVDRADRVDHDEPCTVGACLLDHRPQVTVGEAGVRAPEDDQLRVAQLLRSEPLRRAVRHLHAGADGRPADRTDEPGARRGGSRSARRTPIARRLWLPASLYGRIASAPCSRIDRVQAIGDLGERLVPRDLLELAAALRPDPAQRVQEPVRAVDAVEERVHLRAQLALAVRVLRVAAQLHGDRLPSRSSVVTCHPQLSGQSW